ncbi:MAG: aminotransferase class V-fold PLP-dependent enzyme [Gammaproteobacteria bacterium]|nr:aminotransferase class V-fold PLP-dependent enzyme [Gammaproteobacteria bacterium]
MASPPNPFIHLNAAGASICSQEVLQTQIDYLCLEQKMGGYGAADFHQARWELLYQQVGQLINAAPTHIALQESASRAMQNALLSIPWQKGDQVLISSKEYGAHYIALLQLKQQYELEIIFLPEKEGDLDWVAVSSLLTERVKAVIVTWIGSHNGGVLDVIKLGQLVSNSSAYYLIDGCQALGQIAVDVSKLNCDFLSATGRKFLRGPRGTGFLYVAQRVLEEELFPVVTDHAAARLIDDNTWRLDETARRFELWEANWAARAGLQQAISELLANQQVIYDSIQRLSSELRDMLSESGVVEIADTGAQLSGIISFRHKKASVERVKQALDSGNVISSVITQDAGWIDLRHREITQLNRLSVHVYNRVEEFSEVIDCLENL